MWKKTIRKKNNPAGRRWQWAVTLRPLRGMKIEEGTHHATAEGVESVPTGRGQRDAGLNSQILYLASKEY